MEDRCCLNSTQHEELKFIREDIMRIDYRRLGAKNQKEREALKKILEGLYAKLILLKKMLPLPERN